MSSNLPTAARTSDVHLCLVGPNGHDSERQLRAFFEGLAATFVERELRVLVDRVHGPAECRTAVLAARQWAYAQAGLGEPWPCSYVCGRGDDHLGRISVQLWAVAGAVGAAASDGTELERGGAKVALRTVRAEGCAGRLLETPDARVLWLSSVDGRDERGMLVQGRCEQATRMFERASLALAGEGFHYREVVRTWIQLREILQWYVPFNAVRSRFHQQHGVGEGGRHCPASTGVQGAARDEHCVMDLLAVAPRGPRAAAELIAASALQGDAREYGSGFSRAALLELAAHRTLLVSGTASIGLDGLTVHASDDAGQSRQTLRAVAALLAACGAGWSNVVAATLYCRDRDALRAFEQVATRLGIGAVPFVPVLADLCRQDLSVELDAVVQCPTPPPFAALPGDGAPGSDAAGGLRSAGHEGGA